MGKTESLLLKKLSWNNYFISKECVKEMHSISSLNTQNCLSNGRNVGLGEGRTRWNPRPLPLPLFLLLSDLLLSQQLRAQAVHRGFPGGLQVMSPGHRKGHRKQCLEGILPHITANNYLWQTKANLTERVLL